MTQVDIIRKIIATLGRGEFITTGEIFEKTDFPKPSIRRILSKLVKDDELVRERRGIFQTAQPRGGLLVEEEQWYRKFIGTQKYRGNPRQFFAITFERNDIDRENELLGQLDRFLNQEYVESAGNTGYAHDVVEARDIDRNFIFPSIQTGEL